MAFNELFKTMAMPVKGMEVNDPGMILEWMDINDRHFWLDGDIEWETSIFFIRMLQYLNRTNTHPNPKPIHLHICSDGGDLMTMFAIYNAIRTSDIPVYTYNEGAAHSAAFAIFLAGEKRFAHPYAVSIAHEGGSSLAGSFRESKAAMKQYEQSIQTMKDLIVARCDLTLEEIEKRFEVSQDWHIDFENMKKYNIVNATYGVDDDVSEWDVNLGENSF